MLSSMLCVCIVSVSVCVAFGRFSKLLNSFICLETQTSNNYLSNNSSDN